MAYNNEAMFEPVGVAALDPKVAAYKKFMKENLGQPDLLKFLQSEQGRQLDPNLAGAMIVLDKLEKARDSAPQGPPPTTSVVQDVGMAGLQKAKAAQMMQAQQQGLMQLPNPAMENAQFQGGITAPTQRMAGGGIVAFAGGGAMPGWTQADQEQLEALQKMMNTGYFLDPYGRPVYTGESSEALRKAQSDRGSDYARLLQRKRAADEAAKAAKLESAARAEEARFGYRPEPKPPVAVSPSDYPDWMKAAYGPRAATLPQPTRAPAGGVAALAKPAVQAPAPVTPPAPDQFMPENDFLKQMAARRAASGMDEVSRARNEELARRRAALEAEGKADPAQRKKDILKALSAAAFGSIGKDASLLRGIGTVGSAFAESTAGIEKEYKGKEETRKLRNDALMDAELSMKEAEAARKLGDFTTYDTKKAEFEAKMLNIRNMDRNYALEQRKVATGERQVDLLGKHYAATEANQRAAAQAGLAKAIKSGQMNEYQYRTLAEKIRSTIDVDSVRQQLAKQQGFSKIPQAGKEPLFDKAVSNAVNRMIYERIAMDYATAASSPDYTMGVPEEVEEE